jgi:hypothetical protein
VTRTTCDKIANRKPDDDQAQGVKEPSQKRASEYWQDVPACGVVTMMGYSSFHDI